MDKIQEYNFGEFISQADVDKYRPGVDGFLFNKEDIMNKEEAIELLDKTQKISVEFLDNMISKADSIKNVDEEIAKKQYLLNFSHETEHLGQLKYLIGTWKRMNE